MISTDACDRATCISKRRTWSIRALLPMRIVSSWDRMEVFSSGAEIIVLLQAACARSAILSPFKRHVD